MKKIYSIAISAALLMGVAACESTFDKIPEPERQVIPEGATLTLGFGVPAEDPTRADMADEPTIESMHVLVFDEKGLLLQSKKAEIGTTVTKNYDGTPATVTYWKAEVLMSAKERHIHFLANIPEEDVPSAGDETSIFSTLAVEAPAAAYWQRIVVDNILPYTYDGSGKYSFVDNNGVLQKDVAVPGSVEDDGSYEDRSGFTVNNGDYINRDGDKIINGTGYYVSLDISEKLALVRLVRNFARIKFTNKWSSFTLKKIALVNVPAAGLVAPYNGNDEEVFESEYSGLSGANSIPQISNITSYSPTLPSAGINTDCPETFVSANDDQEATLFMYERAIPSSNATCVLIGGVLNGATAAQKDSDGNTWFKIEIAKDDGSYFPIFRDFTYNMEVTNIDPSATRYASAEAAYNAVPVGDISGSTETATLTQITDGKGLALWVQYIDYPDLEGGKTVGLLYTFYYENGGNTTYFCDGTSDRVTFSRVAKANSTLDWATTDVVEKKGVVSSSSNSDYLSLVPNSSYTWYLAEVTLNPKGDEALQSDILVEGAVTTSDATHYVKKLSRNVTYTVMGQQKLALKTSGVTSDASGNTTAVTITLPGTLGSSVFPLTLKIEAEDNNLTPTDNLPVESGKSAFDSSKNTFYFLKTISYNEYQSSKTFTCGFKTTKATGKTPVSRIMVTEKTSREQSWFKGGDDATVALAVGSESSN